MLSKSSRRIWRPETSRTHPSKAASLSQGPAPALLPASEIEKLLLDALRRLPTLRNTQSVTIRPYSGPKGWSWELDRIEPNVGPKQFAFAEVTNVVARLQQQYDLDLSPPPPA